MTRRFFSSLIALGLAGCAPAPFDGTQWNHPDGAPAGLVHATFHARAIDQDVGYDIYLPDDYAADPKRRFPVVIFLHGKFGDEHTEARRFAQYLETGRPPQAIVVFPNGGRVSKYIDAEPGSRMSGAIMSETMIARDLVDHIDASYRTLATRESRALQGFSMGGMGALRLAFSYPDRFESVYAYAPAVDDTAENIAEEEPELLKDMLNGDPRQWERRMARTLGAQRADALRGKLRIAISTGEHDDLGPAIDDLVATLRAHDLPVRATRVAGLYHEYRFGENFAFAAGGD